MILQGNCIDKLKELPDSSVDAVVTDPPYELGFMGKSWDNTGIANNVDMWKECLRVLKSGGYLLSFGGTRTYHRMASAIEDAGFEVRDMIEWVYGSGFPKSLNIGKAVDKLQGNERVITGSEQKAKPTFHSQNVGGEIKEIDNIQITKGTSEWEGWGTALKPAHEPICMARKPLAEKTVAENCLKYGTGGINIDGSRVGTEERTYGGMSANKPDIGTFRDDNWQPKDIEVTVNGRFPANLIHDGSEEVRECFPNESERFFKSIIYTAKASKSERNMGLENFEEKKVNDGRDTPIDNAFQRGETKRTNTHPTVKPIALMEYLINMVTREGQTVLDPFAGSGTTLIAAKKLGRKYIGIELEPEYVKIAEARLGSVVENPPSLF